MPSFNLHLIVANNLTAIFRYSCVDRKTHQHWDVLVVVRCRLVTGIRLCVMLANTFDMCLIIGRSEVFTREFSWCLVCLFVSLRQTSGSNFTFVFFFSSFRGFKCWYFLKKHFLELKWKSEKCSRRKHLKEFVRFEMTRHTLLKLNDRC